MRHARIRERSRPTLSQVSSAPGMLNAGSHMSLSQPGPSGISGLQETALCEWGNTVYHPSTLSRP